MDGELTTKGRWDATLDGLHYSRQTDFLNPHRFDSDLLFYGCFPMVGWAGGVSVVNTQVMLNGLCNTFLSDSKSNVAISSVSTNRTSASNGST